MSCKRLLSRLWAFSKFPEFGEEGFIWLAIEIPLQINYPGSGQKRLVCARGRWARLVIQVLSDSWFFSILKPQIKGEKVKAMFSFSVQK